MIAIQARVGSEQAVLQARRDPLLKSRAPGSWAISCDFDGTITTEDVVFAMLTRFAEPAWREAEAEWEAGLIGSRVCLERQTRLLRVSESALAEWVDQQPVDPDIGAFFADCARNGLDLRIVSDGYDWVIDRVLARLGWEEIPVFANHLVPLADDRWAVTFPHARPGCDAGACKCRAISQTGPRVHIGDGRSDICVAEVSDRVIAKGSLLDHRTRRGSPTAAFETFAEVRMLVDAF